MTNHPFNWPQKKKQHSISDISIHLLYEMIISLEWYIRVLVFMHIFKRVCTCLCAYVCVTFVYVYACLCVLEFFVAKRQSACLCTHACVLVCDCAVMLPQYGTYCNYVPAISYRQTIRRLKLQLVRQFMGTTKHV